MERMLNDRKEQILDKNKVVVLKKLPTERMSTIEISQNDLQELKKMKDMEYDKYNC